MNDQVTNFLTDNTNYFKMQQLKRFHNHAILKKKIQHFLEKIKNHVSTNSILHQPPVSLL